MISLWQANFRTSDADEARNVKEKPSDFSSATYITVSICKVSNIICFSLSLSASLSPSLVDVIISKQVSLPVNGNPPMDLSVTRRLLHPGPDSAMLAPRPPFFMGSLTAQHCAQFSQQHLQVRSNSDVSSHLVELDSDIMKLQHELDIAWISALAEISQIKSLHWKFLFLQTSVHGNRDQIPSWHFAPVPKLLHLAFIYVTIR